MTVTVYVPRDASALSVGAAHVAEAISKEASARGVELRLVRNGSRGAFWLEPLVEVVTPKGRVIGSLADIQRSGMASRGFSEFLEELEGNAPSTPVDGFIPLHIDQEEASRSLHDSLLRALNATGNSKIGAGDIICITRSQEMSDGPRSMFLSRDAVQLIKELRSAGFVILTGLSADAQSPVDKAADAAVESPKQLAKVAKGLLLKHKLEETAVLRLRGSRKASLTAA